MSDYLNQKMEGLMKANNAHWGEVMNRKMFDMAERKRREYDAAGEVNRLIAKMYAEAVDRVISQESDAETPALDERDLQDSDTRLA